VSSNGATVVAANREEQYRRLARECLENAQTFPLGKWRTALLQMAQVWQRLADEGNHGPNREVPLRQPTTEQIRPAVQQQQQIQPQNDESRKSPARHGSGT
jgi:hypothetical protein